MIRVGDAPGQAALFGSDMHLGEHDPATAALFLDTLARHAAGTSHLFLLGDLFEAWVGDDQPDAQAATLIGRLATLAAGGVHVFVMRGNRDFLLDVPLPAEGGSGAALRFSSRASVTMLDDPTTITLYGRKVVLAHGDAQCTDDTAYQKARALARSPRWQHDFLRRPLAERLQTGRALRDESRRVQALRAMDGGDPHDVVAAAIDETMRDAGVSTMIHGHTHRPACHRWTLDGEPATRWVLPDWHAAGNENEEEHDVARGGFLRVDAAGWATIPL